jgi:hypothetical protein
LQARVPPRAFSDSSTSYESVAGLGGKVPTEKAKKAKVQKGKHSRWGRQLQLRCSSKVLWELISFSGRFDLEILDAGGGAPQPAATDDRAPEAAAADLAEQRMHKRAMEARAELHLARRLASKRRSI